MNCKHCGNEVPSEKGTQAIYCSKRCRKRAAEKRRRQRGNELAIGYAICFRCGGTFKQSVCEDAFCSEKCVSDSLKDFLRENPDELNDLEFFDEEFLEPLGLRLFDNSEN